MPSCLEKTKGSVSDSVYRPIIIASFSSFLRVASYERVQLHFVKLHKLQNFCKVTEKQNVLLDVVHARCL